MHKGSSTFSKPQHENKLSDAGHKIVHDLHDLRDDAQTLKTDIRDAAHTAADVAHHAGARVRGATETIIDAPGFFAHKVRNNPIQSTLIALAIGLIVGKLHRR